MDYKNIKDDTDIEREIKKNMTCMVELTILPESVKSVHIW